MPARHHRRTHSGTPHGTAAPHARRQDLRRPDPRYRGAVRGPGGWEVITVFGAGATQMSLQDQIR
ncbi:hypothetical protein ACFPM0_15700 [Pseudonocardia sulfidoxydans]|uniref:hypothetical protein n=1 Tax=Pseudonocardia sulfidoxydans TaxID=54011 RepID=UPI003614D9CB